tara:strand:- start:8752 stop:9171 length:420 start_codon:yes stop_codon:yes gene_type:complete
MNLYIFQDKNLNKILNKEDFVFISDVENAILFIDKNSLIIKEDDIDTIFNILIERYDNSSIVIESIKIYKNIYKAKYSDNLWKKLNYLEQSILLADIAVKKYPLSRDIRLLRYNIQNNIPIFFRENEIIKNDKKFIFGS